MIANGLVMLNLLKPQNLFDFLKKLVQISSKLSLEETFKTYAYPVANEPDWISKEVTPN